MFKQVSKPVKMAIINCEDIQLWLNNPAKSHKILFFEINIPNYKKGAVVRCQILSKFRKSLLIESSNAPKKFNPKAIVSMNKIYMLLFRIFAESKTVFRFEISLLVFDKLHF